MFRLVAIVAAAAVASAMPIRISEGFTHDSTVHEVAPECFRTDGMECQQSDWVRVGRAEATDAHTVFVGVRRRNMDQLEELLAQASDPRSASYGKWMTAAEVRALTSWPEATEAVERWLRMHGLSVWTLSTGEYVEATGAVESFEAMLDTEFHEYHSEHSKRGNKVLRALRYSVPVELRPYVSIVGDVVNFPATLRPEPIFSSMATPDASGQTTPSLLNSFYKVSSNTVAHKNATQAVYEALGQSYSPSDLAAFQSRYNVPSQPVFKVIGPNSPSDCANPNSCAEASLDIQYLIAMAQGTDTTFWSISQSTQDIFYAWAKQLLAAPVKPLVHSISYGSIEKEEPASNLQHFDQDIATLAMQGLTVVVASGDDGVANFIARSNPSACGFSPSFPATSPHVLAVGATQGPEFSQPEIMCSSKTGGLITSGGGFSTVFATASYQSSTVSNFLSNGKNVPPTSMFNAQGRGYPDVAMLGHNYVVGIGGSYYILSGTSCSTPVTAALITLVNGMRLAAGKSPLGFVTPAIYQHSSIFQDITSGENNCCAGQGGQEVCCQYGFTASTGWEPACGFGSINFSTFASTFSAL